ncbi:transcriptional regulator with XRE-family HTH domain [Paenibacillus mucilaginosus]|uniref:helix-turn-helix domain-containing protein n=1 Tax=Paenibacillus mucilaginosus TaxID=61624 RepID=UPI003D1AFBBD
MRRMKSVILTPEWIRQLQDLGVYLRELRMQNGLSLRAAAKEARISQAYISDLEHGINRGSKKPFLPSPQILEALSQTYGVSYVTLLRMAGHLVESPGKQELRLFIDDLSEEECVQALIVLKSMWNRNNEQVG